MQTFYDYSPANNDFNKAFSNTSLLLLDIETTGFSPDLSTIFMIGCGYYAENRLYTIQWLADSLELESEQEILSAFSNWLNEHFHSTDTVQVFTYNGQVFDLPFLQNRYDQCRLANPLNEQKYSAVDLYRKFLPLKDVLTPPNMKLKTLSHHLGYQHSKAPEGRRLIKAYHDYIKAKDPATLNLLFLHNTDDLKSLHHILPIYHYLYFFDGSYDIAESFILQSTHMVWRLKPSYILPASFSYEDFGCQLDVSRHEAQLIVPIYPSGLRYYYNDYKNYVYLPEEDYALHKSMAKYIDKNHWQKASQENCYTWFLPDQNFMDHPEKQREYIQMIFRLFGFLR